MRWPKHIQTVKYALIEAYLYSFRHSLTNHQVTGIDIFPRNPDNYADNVELLCDDLNQSLLAILDLNTFDVINSRFIEAGLHRKRWQSYIRELAR